MLWRRQKSLEAVGNQTPDPTQTALSKLPKKIAIKN
jgi:hypothetical protein